MINFKTKLPKWEIHDENGNSINAYELTDKSIKTDAMALEFVSTLHHVESYMKALDNKMLLNLFMKYMDRFADACVEKSKTDEHWDSVYNTAIVYDLDNFIDRYSKTFEAHGINTAYALQSEIKTLYANAIRNPNVSINDKEITDFDLVRLCVDKDIIRANSAGFKALLQHYTDEQFLKNLTDHLSNCGYSSEQTNFWFITLEIIRRIEHDEIQQKRGG